MNEGYPELRQHWQQLSNVTLREVIDWCIEHGLDIEKVTTTQVHLKYLSPETDEERERREKFELDHQRRTEAWERETLARLKEKYEHQ